MLPSVPDEPDEQPSGGAGIVPVPVPEELAVVPPGAALAGLLEDIEVEQVSGYDAVEVMCAEYRQLCRQSARFFRAVLETGLRKPFSISTVQRVHPPGEFAAEEARAALVWSRSRAERAFAFAVEIFDRLPLLGEAMLAGELDEPRARALIDWTVGLTGAQAGAVCEQLLPEAAGLTVGELIDRIKRACLGIDPGWAERRYRVAVRTRRVRGFLGPDGAGTLTGQSQPAERVIAACERIDALARACKRAGDARKIDLIRSDLFLGMTDGTFEGLTEPQIIAHVLAHPYLLPGDDSDTDGDDPNGGGGTNGDDPEPGEPGSGSARAGARAESGNEPAESGSPAGVSRSAWAVPEVRVQLGMLLGCNGEPAEVPGWGYVPGWLARQLVARMHSAQWRYALCDTSGHVTDGGLITTRPELPDHARARRDARRGGIVEIAFRADQPAALTDTTSVPPELAAAWAPVLAELADAGTATGDTPPTGRRDERRRTPGGALRRLIQQRDRRCIHPCCRVPATRADQDHRIGYANGGPTTDANLSTPCRHDHRLKDEAGWAIDKPESGLTIWTSPLGHHYQSRPPPAIPPPVPVRTYQPRDDIWHPGQRTSQATGCGCIITPCPHDRQTAAAVGADTEGAAGYESAPVNTRILDDSEPPF